MKARERIWQAHVPIDHHDQGHEFYPLSDKLSDCHPDPESLFRERELQDKVERLSEHLSPAVRKTFRLRTLDELSTRETAMALGLREAAVKTRVSRARVHLRRMLQKGYGARLRPRVFSRLQYPSSRPFGTILRGIPIRESVDDTRLGYSLIALSTPI